jgi:hypothetical protein
MFTLLRCDTQFCIALNMERLFSPCTRLRDRFVSRGRREWFQELNLDVSTEEFLSTERAFTYADLCAMLEGPCLCAGLGNEETIAWLTPHAAVARKDAEVLDPWENLEKPYRFGFDADGNDIEALAPSPEHLVEICDVVLRLLAASVVHSVFLRKKGSRGSCGLINALSMAYLMEHCQSLQLLVLKDLELDENHCRMLGSYSRPGLEIELISCNFTSAGASALVEVLRRNQGPTKLDCCGIDNFVLANGLRGNSHLKSLKQNFFGDFSVCNRQILALANALRENKGLVELSLKCFGAIDAMNEGTWGAVCDSLKTHSTLEVLDFCVYIANATTAPAQLEFRMNALVNMLKVNTLIHTLHLDSRYSQHHLFQGSVVPYLQTNHFRPRVRVIQKTRSITYRAKVLGRALLAARTHPNHFWMLLSGNAEVAFPSTAATTTPDENLPTSATAATTVNVAPVATASVTATSHILVAPASGQKRKAVP